MDPRDADLDERRPRPASGATPGALHSWMAFFGGAVVPVLAVLIAVGIWHLAGSGTAELTAREQAEAEALLDQLGFPPGPVDGVIDEDSRSAIRDYQLTAGLKVDGKLDLGLLDELRAAKAELSGN